MSAMMSLSVTQKKKIRKDLINSKMLKFSDELMKILAVIAEYPFLKDFENDLQELKKSYKAKLEEISINDIDYEQHKYIANITESEYMQKLFELKSKIFIQKDRYLSVISKYEISKNIKRIEEYFKDENNELEIFIELVRKIDMKEADRISSLKHPIEFKIKEAKVTYLKLFNTTLIKDEIQSNMNEFDYMEKEKVKIFLSQKMIDKKSYREFMHKHYLNQQNQELHTIQKSFETLGYSFDEDIKENILQYISTKDDEYKIAIRVVDSQVSLVFTRLIKRGMTLSQYEKAKDIQKAKEWCSNFENIKKVMLQNGLNIDENARLEPTLESIRYEEVDDIMVEGELLLSTTYKKYN